MADDPKTTNGTTSVYWLRRFISLGALLIALVHLIWPGLTIDLVTLALILIAILPWLAPLIKTLELPGGWKVEFQDLQNAGVRAASAGLLAPAASEAETNFSFQLIAENDPNLALAGLRIEIEKRLIQLTEAHNLPLTSSRGVGQLLRILDKADVLTNDQRAILYDMTNMLNSAVHGASVDQRAADWAIEIGPRLLTSLDERINEANKTSRD